MAIAASIGVASAICGYTLGMDSKCTNNARGIRPLALTLVLLGAAGMFATQAAPASAQVNSYERWNAQWDAGAYDHHHILVGTIASFTPYRMLLSRDRNGETTQVDLKRGTRIRPDGMNLSPGEHVAVMGYWSKGTFIANRIVLRS